MNRELKRYDIFEDRLEVVPDGDWVQWEDVEDVYNDGVIARTIAIERLIALGTLIECDVFDEELWRKTLDGIRLEEINRQLRGFELRFDRMHPPKGADDES